MNDPDFNKLFDTLKSEPKRFLKSDNGILKVLGVLYRFRSKLFHAGLSRPSFVIPDHILRNIPNNIYRDWMNRNFSSLKNAILGVSHKYSTELSAMMSDQQRDMLNQLKKKQQVPTLSARAVDTIHRNLYLYISQSQMEIDKLSLEELEYSWNSFHDKEWSYLKRLFLRKNIEKNIKNLSPKDIQKIHGMIPVKDLSILLRFMEKPKTFISAMPHRFQKVYEDEMVNTHKLDFENILKGIQVLNTFLKENLELEEDDPTWSLEIPDNILMATQAIVNLKQATESQDRIECLENLREQIVAFENPNDLENELLFRILWELQKANVSAPAILQTCHNVLVWAVKKCGDDLQQKLTLHAMVGLPSRNVLLKQVYAMTVFHDILNGHFENAQKLYDVMRANGTSLFDHEIENCLFKKDE